MTKKSIRAGFVITFLLILASMSLAAPTAAQMDDYSCSSDMEQKIVWVSPRGTLEVMDEYPIYAALEMGYFDELGVEVELQAGPLGGANVMSLLPAGQADMGFPSPGVLASSIDAGIPVLIAFEMTATQVFDFAMPSDSDIETIADLEGKTISLGSAGWQPIVDPILAEAGIDLDSVTYVEGGAQWGQIVDQGRADAALAWEGLRAQWDAIGLDFKYLIGAEFSNDPSNGYAIRSADLEDADQANAMACFFRGLAMGLEFSRVNPQAAAQITYGQFPALAEQMDPPLAMESMRQLMVTFNHMNAMGYGYGYSDMEAWQNYFDRLADLGQIENPIAVEDAITNHFVEFANDFDRDQVAADAEAFELNEDWADVELQGPVEPESM